MKADKKAIKILVTIAILMIITAGLWLAFCYDFFHSGLSFNSEKGKIYNAVCKNIDIRSQYIGYINVDDDSIGIWIKNNFLVIFNLIDEDDSDLINYQSMFNIYDDLKPFCKDINVSVGAIGSSYCDYSFYNGNLEINKSWLYEHGESYVSGFEILNSAMHRDDVKQIDARGLLLSEITEELPENNSIEYLHTNTANEDISDPLKKFKALKTLDLNISGAEYKNGQHFEVNFLNELPQLETLILHTNTDYLDFPNVINSDIKTLEIRYQGDNTINVDSIKVHFPNANITIVEDTYY